MLHKYTVVFVVEESRLGTIVEAIAPENIFSLKEEREVTKIIQINLDPATLQEKRAPMLANIEKCK